MLLSKLTLDGYRVKAIDEHLRAPKGGVIVKGKEFRGGEFIPSEGGYAAEYKKSLQKKEPENKKEPKHKRIDTSTLGIAKKNDDGKWVTEFGEPLPEHLSGVHIPPGYTNVFYNKNPESNVLACGVDAAGRKQVIYAKSHHDRKKAIKFSRVRELDKQFKNIMNEIANEKERKEEALIMKMIAMTGVRPGSEEDTKAQVQAYGATTLQKQHVAVEDGKVYLKFIGKRGVQNNILIPDQNVGKLIWNRANQLKNNEDTLFKTNYNRLLDYSKSLDGGKFTTKDFRTLHATKTAMKKVAEIESPTDEKDYKKKVSEVAKHTASILGNTATVCLQSYIDPLVFAEWKLKAGVN